ncbi:MAG: acyl-CoA dehydrogenase [Spirochaetaceae bacterium]|nr:MAG: acyl-CoA dehydrogenase [Spirochaetaceae bacterium]
MNTNPTDKTMTTQVPFSQFIERVRERVRSAFADPAIDQGSRGMTPEFLSPILETEPLSVFIPSLYGGRGQDTGECLSLLEACSYESLAFSLTMGINGALFLQPVSRYAAESVQADVFPRFLSENALGGLMITEPDYGSDALQMRTRFRSVDGGFHLQGTKHWGGLTGQADYWLLTARGESERGDLERAISFFIWDRSLGGIDVEEYFDNLGLYPIPYGRNRIDTIIPEERRFAPQTSGVRMLLDLLHRSRLQFPGMAMGYLKRLLDEGIAHCQSRLVGGRPLSEYDQVQDRLADLQAAFTTCSAMCAYTTEVATIDHDCSNDALPANSIKSVVTDLMQSTAQSLLQLVGAKGYRLDHIAGRSVVDSRPFQIFEGSNDILYQQIAEAVLKSMNKVKETNLARFLSSFDLTNRVADHFTSLLSFSIDTGTAQRKMVDLGRILGRVISMQMVVDLGARGFRNDLVQNCLTLMKRDVVNLLGSFSDAGAPTVVEDYEENGDWLACRS